MQKLFGKIIAIVKLKESRKRIQRSGLQIVTFHHVEKAVIGLLVLIRKEHKENIW